MEPADLNYDQKAVVENAKWVDTVLLSGIAVGSISIAAKLLGATKFKLYELELSVIHVWILFVVLTIAHWYSAWLLNRAILHLWSTNSDELCLAAFREVTTTGGLFVRGLSPRTKATSKLRGIRVYEMRLDDPSTWVAHLSAILGVVAIVPFDFTDQRLFCVMLLVGCVIMTVNWFIGSTWIVRLSELAILHEKAWLLPRVCYALLGLSVVYSGHDTKRLSQ